MDLRIASALAAADPTNANWQRDLVISHITIGDLLRNTGELQPARAHYGDALAIIVRLDGPDDPYAVELREKMQPPDGSAVS